MTWRPRGARTHVALVGKGITFDTGAVSRLKPSNAMLLMRKDMAGAAAVVAATLGAAVLKLPCPGHGGSAVGGEPAQWLCHASG